MATKRPYCINRECEIKRIMGRVENSEHDRRMNLLSISRQIRNLGYWRGYMKEIIHSRCSNY